VVDLGLVGAVAPLYFADIYENPQLASALSKIENLLGVVSEEQLFENLVNPSTSKSRPYYRWARYREGYSGDLVKELIHRSHLDPERHFIFDPMCGSGSTLIASVQLGFDCLGTDVNPYAIDVSNAKTCIYPPESLDRVEAFIRETVPLQFAYQHEPWKSMENCSMYFREEHYKILQSIINAIGHVDDPVAQQLLFVIWLMVLEDCSEKMKDGNGLATRPSRVKDVWDRFVSQVRMVLSDLRNHSLPKDVTTLAVHVTAAKTVSTVEAFRQRTGKQLGAIIFSPPYANSFDYFESYKLELLCGYYGPEGLVEARKSAIRSYRKGYGYQLTTDDDLVQMLCKEIKKRIPVKEAKFGKVDNRTRLVPNLLIGYFQDMKEVIRTFASYMPSKSTCHIVVDQSAYLGIIVPTDLVLANIALRNGFEVSQLIRCRPAKSSVQQLKEYPYLKTMLRESILSLTKM
jgi:hypothetical protein